jgi:hypothetical protein
LAPDHPRHGRHRHARIDRDFIKRISRVGNFVSCTAAPDAPAVFPADARARRRPSPEPGRLDDAFAFSRVRLMPRWVCARRGLIPVATYMTAISGSSREDSEYDATLRRHPHHRYHPCAAGPLPPTSSLCRADVIKVGALTARPEPGEQHRPPQPAQHGDLV